MSVASWLRSVFTTQDPTTYRTAIDGNFTVVERVSAIFAPQQIATPNMTMQVRSGVVFDNGTLTEVAQQTTTTFTAPVTLPRIDRVVLDQRTGAYSVVAGTPAITPVAPAIPAGKMPCAQILFQTTSTVITNSMITDERCFDSLSKAYADTVYAVFPSGTRMPFHQSAAPTGWTKDTTAGLNDSAMRIVTSGVGGGSGGTYNFSAGCTVVAAHTHTFSATSGGNSVDHSHSGTTSGNSAAHNHTFNVYNDSASNGPYPGSRNNTAGANAAFTDGLNNSDHTHTFTTGGASAVHTHVVSGTTTDSNNSATWIPKYIDMIIAVKN